MSTVTVQQSVQLKTTGCYSCGVIFGMPAQFYDDRLEDHKNFYCPNGHSQCFVGKTEAEKLRDELERERRRVIQANASRDRAWAETEAIERRRRALKGALTKAKKRAGAGVCPVVTCKRTVRQMADHIKTVHPDYEVSEADAAVPVP